MMGDNRHNSEDSRYWDLYQKIIVGKPVFIWLSWDTNGKGFNKIRWDRVFQPLAVKDNHSPTFFLIALAVFCW
jgi:signal peptidase I